MFSGYKVNNGILYLYIDCKYEIGSFDKGDNKKSIIDSVKKYIRDQKIKFVGVKVVLLLSGLVIGSVYLNKDIKKNTYEVYPSKNYVYNIVETKVPMVSYDIPIIEKESDKEVDNNDNLDIKVKQDIKINENIVDKVLSSNESQEVGVQKQTNIEVKSNNMEEIKTNEKENLITVYRKNGDILNLNLNDYLIGVVASEMPASFNEEALKAQSVVARTYTMKLIESNRKITDDVSTQVYKDNIELKSMWQDAYDSYYNKIKNAVLLTDNEVIKYNDKLIDAVYHSTSNGYTENSYYVWNNNIPYLKSVPSSWDTSASSFLKTTDFTYDELSSLLGITIDKDSVIEIVSRNESNRITEIKFNDNSFTGIEIRKLLNLRSADFDILEIDNGIRFTTRGYGHGVGMSQYGANGMAQAGYNYKQILNYYYSNVSIDKIDS